MNNYNFPGTTMNISGQLDISTLTIGFDPNKAWLTRMSILLYLPFNSLFGAEEFRVSNIKYALLEHAELDDSCVVSRDSSDRIQIRYNQHLTRRGAIGGEFWELLVSSLLSHQLECQCNCELCFPKLGIARSEKLVQAVNKHLKPLRSALLIMLRTSSAQFSASRFQSAYPNTIYQEFSDDDELAIQKCVTARQQSNAHLYFKR